LGGARGFLGRGKGNVAMTIDEIIRQVESGETLKLPTRSWYAVETAMQMVKGSYIWDVEINGRVATIRKSRKEVPQ
jgi:hypothetical protein